MDFSFICLVSSLVHLAAWQGSHVNFAGLETAVPSVQRDLLGVVQTVVHALSLPFPPPRLIIGGIRFHYPLLESSLGCPNAFLPYIMLSPLL